MKLLIAVDKTRFLYLQRFSTELKKKGIESLVVDDLDIYDNSKFNKKYLRWTKTPEKISKIINEFKPDLVLIFYIFDVFLSNKKNLNIKNFIKQNLMDNINYKYYKDYSHHSYPHRKIQRCRGI